MKLRDNEVLEDSCYWLIRDQWKPEWEKGVQVPVKTISEFNKPTTNYFEIKNSNKNPKRVQLKLPKKFLCSIKDKKLNESIHDAYVTHDLIEHVCRYDSDELDSSWLLKVNKEFKQMGLEQLTRINFEKIIENYETQTNIKLKEAYKALDAYSIEYDDEVVCDVCRSPDSEDSNEMVFCDGCNLCVHQFCYGILEIPQGSWLCAPCELNIKQPQCLLCPNIGGAMKCTKRGNTWCHVSCALWIPESSFADLDKMEPIVNLSQIPLARWNLICHLCKQKRGCCFQCSEKKCHASFHITCAFKYNLEMNTYLNDTNNEQILFRGYCAKHTKRRQKLLKSTDDSTIESQDNKQQSPIKNLCSLNDNDRKKELERRKESLNEEFYKYISIDETRMKLKLNRIHLDFVFNYWKLKRRFNQNKSLLIAKSDEDLLIQSERALNDRIKLFVYLRHDLERVRNLCHMTIRREKLKLKLINTNRDLFWNQCDFLHKFGSKNKEIFLKTKQCLYDDLLDDNNYYIKELFKQNSNNGEGDNDDEDEQTINGKSKHGLKRVNSDSSLNCKKNKIDVQNSKLSTTPRSLRSTPRQGQNQIT